MLDVLLGTYICSIKYNQSNKLQSIACSLLVMADAPADGGASERSRPRSDTGKVTK